MNLEKEIKKLKSGFSFGFLYFEKYLTRIQSFNHISRFQSTSPMQNLSKNAIKYIEALKKNKYINLSENKNFEKKNTNH